MGPNFGNNVNVYETISNNIGASGFLRLHSKGRSYGAEALSGTSTCTGLRDLV